MFVPFCKLEFLRHRTRLLAWYASIDPARRTDEDVTRLALFSVAAGRGEAPC